MGALQTTQGSVPNVLDNCISKMVATCTKYFLKLCMNCKQKTANKMKKSILKKSGPKQKFSQENQKSGALRNPLGHFPAYRSSLKKSALHRLTGHSAYR